MHVDLKLKCKGGIYSVFDITNMYLKYLTKISRNQPQKNRCVKKLELMKNN